MNTSPEGLRDDALRIWHAGVDAVRSERLVGQWLSVRDGRLHVGDLSPRLSEIGRIAVVGAGKAGAGMAAAVERALGPDVMDAKQLTGWINVPADCVRPLERITLHAARPAGVNEPRKEGVHGAREILRLVESLGPDDLCLCLISGGGSALLPAPVEGISLEAKLAVTRWLSAAAADIRELNTVRKQLSRIKGGGLARACRAGRLVAMIISDVLGDPLDIIASGPTVPDDSSTPSAALDILRRHDAADHGVPDAVFRYLAAKPDQSGEPIRADVTNLIIGNNATAVDAAGMEAERLGYSHAMTSSNRGEGEAEEVGRHLARMALDMADGRAHGAEGPDCLITGGEPVVRLVEPERRGLGGRNQQLALAALEQLANHDAAGRIALLSGGTDGEDGPTDAAGAVVDGRLIAAARNRGLDPSDFLTRNDAYHFFEPLGGLIQTGPTNTNVCDLRVVVVDRR